MSFNAKQSWAQPRFHLQHEAVQLFSCPLLSLSKPYPSTLVVLVGHEPLSIRP